MWELYPWPTDGMISGTTTTGFLATANKSIVLHDLLPRNENREEPNKAKVQLPNVVASNEEGGQPRRRRRRRRRRKKCEKWNRKKAISMKFNFVVSVVWGFKEQDRDNIQMSSLLLLMLQTPSHLISLIRTLIHSLANATCLRMYHTLSVTKSNHSLTFTH